MVESQASPPALSLANQGYQVDLVEKEQELGGLLRFVNRVFSYPISLHHSS